MSDEVEVLFNTKKNENMSLSYSRISDFDKNGAKCLLHRTFVENDGARIGSVTDDMLFNSDKFDEIYYIFDGTRPTASLGKLCDIILNNYTEVPSKEEVLKLIKKAELWSSIRDVKKLIGKFDTKQFWGFLDAQFASKEKTLVTTEDIILAEELANILQTHEYSRYIFDTPYESQFKFSIEYNNFVIKGFIDLIKIDHDKKTIRLIDLKTGANPLLEFSDSFLKWRYYIQEAVYMLAVEEVKKHYNIEDYEVLPFQFLYISRYEKIPFVFEVSEKWHNAALKGFELYGKYKRRGLDELLENIRWHLHNQEFNLPKEVYESKGFLPLNDDFIDVLL